MADMEIRLVEGRANAHFKGLTLQTGGEGNPSAFDLFIASLGACAALTAAGYCRSRNIDSEGLQILVDVERNPDTRLASKIKMEIVLPEGFPAEHRDRLVKAANACFVKKHLYEQPEFETTVREA
ncbi:MAG: osmotically inducible protein OsmC [Firmicutes bacterium]|nr:osmotically inducible protein OsmC [Bacillota bacterium]